jgi:hypothetical protein
MDRTDHLGGASIDTPSPPRGVAFVGADPGASMGGLRQLAPRVPGNREAARREGHPAVVAGDIKGRHRA